MSHASAPPVSRHGTEGEVAVQLYVTAVALMRAQMTAWRRGELPELLPLKRIAQSMATGASNAAYPLVVALASGPRDDASRAVQSAMLGVAMGRRSSRDARVLRHLALAALLVDAGRARLAGVAGVDLDVFQQLPDALDALAPASSAALAMAKTPSAAAEDSAVTAFEVAWLERPRLGPLYGGELPAHAASRLLVTARAFLEAVGPRGGGNPTSPFEALQKLAAAPPAGRAAVLLLAATLGALPVGTVVELASGAWAIVAPGGGTAGKPLARLLTQPSGAPLDPAPLVDLGVAAEERRIVRVVPAREARFNLARAFVSAG